MALALRAIQIITLLLLCGVFALLMISMTTHSWRGNSQFTFPPLNLALNRTHIFDIHHGLWYKCVDPLTESCIKLNDGSSDDDESKRRGNITRGFIAAALFFTFLSIGLLSINMFIGKESLHKLTSIASITMQILALIGGLAGMSNFTDYFELDKARWVEYRYSYKLGWVGSGLLLVPTIASIAELVMIRRNRNRKSNTKAYNNGMQLK